MTDAERIAELLNRMDLRESPGWTGETVQRRAAMDPESLAGAMVAMLSDVRREERESCIAAIDAEQREWAGDHPRSALDCARERIVKRGAK
jgi:hypothetical protein